MVEAHFGVPMTGGVLNTLNTRLDAEAIAFMLEHGEAKVLLTDTEFAPIVEAALAQARRKPLVIDIADPLGPGRRARSGEHGLRSVHRRRRSRRSTWKPPADEWDAISLNYTSGTTGNPKGVVYHHRGAYLNALSNIIDWGMPRHAVYLWTLPMFHCNGWCFAVDDGRATPAPTSACAGSRRRRSSTRSATHEVTHYCGAPIVHAHADQRAGGDEARASRTR